MKKVLSCILCVIMMIGILPINKCESVQAASIENNIVMYVGKAVMYVNGMPHKIDSEGTVPIVKNGRTLVPIRAIIEAMGGTVGWDGETRTVALSYKNNKMKLVIDNYTATLNGVNKSLDVAPTIINGRTMLPIRFIIENFGCQVFWDGTEEKITIKFSDDSTEPIKRKVIVGTNATLKPFEYYEGNSIEGFDIDLIKTLANDIGFEVEIVDMEFDALMPSLINGNIDMIIAAITATDERKKYCDFTIPYLEIESIYEGQKVNDVFSIAIKKDDSLIARMNEYIRKYQQDGTIERLKEKWEVDNFNWDVF